MHLVVFTLQGSIHFQPILFIFENIMTDSCYGHLYDQKHLCSQDNFRIVFSNTTPTVTQDIIMSKLDKRRKGVYGPPLGKKFIVFVDDINMPNKDDVDSQPPIELLRQLLDHETWYDNKELFPMKLIEMQVIGAMRPPDGSSKAMSGRFIRHFNTINIDLVSPFFINHINKF